MNYMARWLVWCCGALYGDFRCQGPVLWPISSVSVSIANPRSKLLCTHSVSDRDAETRVDSLGGEQWILSSMDEGPDWSCLQQQGIVSCGWQRNVHLMPTVLVGAVATNIWRTISDYHREITRLIYPTPGPSSLSGVLILRF